MNVNTTEPVIDSGRYEFQCLSSVLSINSVKAADFGQYKCWIDDNDSRRGNPRVFGQQEITLTSEPSSLPTKVVYFEKARNQNSDRQILMQCVVQNGPVHWFISPPGSTLIKPIKPIQEISNYLKCLDYKEKSSSSGLYTESFVFFSDVCVFDSFLVYCSSDVQGENATRGRIIVKKGFSYDFDYSSYKFGIELNYNIARILPALLVLFSLIGGIWACKRGKLCGSVSSESAMIMYTPMPSAVPQVSH